MIPAETWYETHDEELLAIVEVFKTWQHYLEGCKHKFFMFTDHNNLQSFMDTKSLSSRQVCWAQEISRYYFHIDYRQSKANAAADALLRFLPRSPDKEEIFRVKNTQIFHWLQFLLTNASISRISSTFSLSLTPLHQVLVCGTHVFLQLCHFWDKIRTKLDAKSPYKASIGGMRLRLQELQEEDAKAPKIRMEKDESWEKIDVVLHHQSLPYIPKLIRTELISRHHNDLIASHFGIETTQELVTKKYSGETLQHNIGNNIKRCNICFASKTVRHKPYSDLQLLPISTHW